MTIATIAGLVAGAALAAAGAAKLARPTWLADAAALAVPTWLARPVPFVEVAVGVLLALNVAHPAAAWAAVGLLVAFTTLLVVRLRQGVRPPCACFGGLSRRPIGPGSIVRNLALLGCAIVATRP